MEMQLIDADYFLIGNSPVVRLFGKTHAGNSVCALINDYRPYFFIESEIIPETIEGVRSIEKVEALIPEGYHKNKKSLFKITLTNPQDVPRIRDSLSQKGISSFEADILFKYRYMIDKGLRGMNWIRFDGTRINSTRAKCACYEATNINPIEREENAKLRYMAIDIECLTTGDRVPMANKDPIIMISFAFMPAYSGKNTFVLLAKPFSGNGAKGFSCEKDLLEEFLRIMDDYDPDVITGYNINTFDLPFILERLRKYKLPTNFGRADKNASILGMSQTFIIPGRVVVDPYPILKRDPWVKFLRYDLNTVSKELLGDTKHEVEYKEMEKLWNSNHRDLTRFVEYARKDAELSLRLVIEKGLLDKFFELAKISGLLLQDTFGGQTRRIETMLLHEFKRLSFVMPKLPNKEDMIKRTREREKKGLKGATVLEPYKGLHAEGCILVLDFKSLYPSIMRTYNISPDTVIVKETKEKYIESPTGARFINPETHKGIFPDILTKLTKTRSSIKKEMRQAKGNKKRILNAKQLALKDMSNSFYGYTGYTRARLYMIDVANSITAYGRKNLEKTKKLIEEKFPVKVIYADTDSAFVKTDIKNLDKVKALGEDISKYVTDSLPGKLELEFEKIYRTFLILSKKRYAGWKFEYNNGWQDGIDMKGIETVRRDWCPLVSEVMNEVLVTILKEGDLKKAIKTVQSVIEKLKNNEIPLEKLTIIKGITKKVDSYEGILPHIELARKLTRRNPLNAPKVGDRIGFVIIRGNQLLSKRAEDPKYATENGLSIDSNYYINSQLFPPIERIFSSVGVEKSEIFGEGRQTNLLTTNKKRNMKRDIDVEFSKKEKITVPVGGWEEFICESCNKSYRRMPLTGTCGCGGRLLISYHGNLGTKIMIK